MYMCFVTGENDFQDAYIFGIYDNMELLTNNVFDDIDPAYDEDILVVTIIKNNRFEYQTNHYYSLNRNDRILVLSSNAYTLPDCIC